MFRTIFNFQIFPFIFNFLFLHYKTDTKNKLSYLHWNFTRVVNTNSHYKFFSFSIFSIEEKNWRKFKNLNWIRDITIRYFYHPFFVVVILSSSFQYYKFTGFICKQNLYSFNRTLLQVDSKFQENIEKTYLWFN